jgi:protein MpaA
LLGYSVEHRPIVAKVWNEGAGRPALVFAAIHGDERTAGTLGEMLSARWRDDPGKLGGNAVILIPVMNPDGYELNTRENARGVDLNRNFPEGWKTDDKKNRDSGAGPLSEPESAILAGLVERENPARIISIHACLKCEGVNNFDGPALELAREMARINGYPAEEEWHKETPGSFGAFAGKSKNIPTVTLELPQVMDSVREWEDNMLAVEAAVNFAP